MKEAGRVNEFDEARHGDMPISSVSAQLCRQQQCLRDPVRSADSEQRHSHQPDAGNHSLERCPRSDRVRGLAERGDLSEQSADDPCDRQLGCLRQSYAHAAGGRDLARDIPLPLGRFVSANLTPGGAIKDWSDGEIFRALRNGVDREGRPLTVMLTTNVRYMSDDDMLAVIAFLRSQQPVENAIPPEQVSLLGSFLGGANLTPQKPAVTAPIVAPEKAPTAEYGHYLTTFLDCRDCHGADLNGGTSQFAPIGPTLRIVKGWSQDEFVSTLRTGVDPSGHTLSVLMPWKASGRMDDTELSALYQYLVSLP